MRFGEPVGVVYGKSRLGIKTIMDYHSEDCQNNPSPIHVFAQNKWYRLI